MDHECYEGYTKIHVDDAGYVYPQLGKFLSFVSQLLKMIIDIQIIFKSILVQHIIFEDILYRYTFADNGMIVDPNEINAEPLTEIFRNEMLIGEVQKREALWNFKIPVTEREYCSEIVGGGSVCYEWYVSQAHFFI